MDQIPPYHEMFNPLLEVLRQRREGLSIADLEPKVFDLMDLSKEVRDIAHKQSGDSRSEVGYRLAWARTYLKKVGLIDNPNRSFWQITAEGLESGEVDPQGIIQRVNGALTNQSDDPQTYLLQWNPKNFDWQDMTQKLIALDDGGKALGRWSCGNTKSIKPGDRFLLMRTGLPPKGLIGHGHVVQGTYEDVHWDEEKAAGGAKSRYVDIRFESLQPTPVIPRFQLKQEPFAKMHWDAQSSGTRVPSQIAELVMDRWDEFKNESPDGQVAVVAKKTPSIVRVTSSEDSQLRTDNAEEPGASGNEIKTSIRIQGLLAKIGSTMGMDYWLPASDRGRVDQAYPGIGENSLLELPLAFDTETMKTVTNIDVIWLQQRSIVRAFEVEHSTAIYSGLLRMADLMALHPNLDIKFHIVAPLDRREKTFKELKRPVFARLSKPLSEVCSYISYENVEKIAALEHLRYMTTADFLDDYSEEAD